MFVHHVYQNVTYKASVIALKFDLTIIFELMA